jgi:hypothetical protein
MPETLAPTTLRPGLIVALSTSLRGNVTYRKVGIDSYTDTAGEQVVIWETKRTTVDPVEHAQAIKTRTAARGRILRVCSLSAFGLLCTEENSEALAEEIRNARALADEFNRSAKTTRIQISVIVGRIAQDDVEAVRAISEELRSLVSDMQTGLQRLDVKAVRDAANKAKALGQMLSDKDQARLEQAISVARKSARRIVRAGTTAAAEIDRRAIAALDVARVSFLDVGEPDVARAAVMAPVFDGLALDLAPPTESRTGRPALSLSPDLDID